MVQAANVLVIKAALGRSEVSFRYMPLNGGRYILSFPNTASAISYSSGLAKMAAVVDTITVTATGFHTKSAYKFSLSIRFQIVTGKDSRYRTEYLTDFFMQ